MSKAIGERWSLGLTTVVCLTLAAGFAHAADAPAMDDQVWDIHIQATATEQAHPAFTSPYRGPDSLDPGARGDETTDVTLFAGVRPWQGGEIWINPEIDQGFGLSDTVGVAGFPSGEAYKVGARDPYLKLQRLFLRQTIDLGAKTEMVNSDINALSAMHARDKVVITIGKFGVPDIFDANDYAHDPRNDFMNWTLIDGGAFDYAADAWGYTVGAAAEWYTGPWTLRGGFFALSTAPNTPGIDFSFHQNQEIVELERRYEIGALSGKALLTGFVSNGRMGQYADAVALALADGQPADIAAVRRYQSRTGLSFTLQQQLSEQLGLFVRASDADGRYETFEFTDVDQSEAIGLQQSGRSWSRQDDKVGVALVVNQASAIHQQFLNLGGVGILAGDGRLPHPGPESILETYYSLEAHKGVHLTFDYQFVDNPAYNRDRGPVSFFGLRLHGQY